MKLCMISLGCDKNLVDAENMLGLLRRDGHTFTDEEQEAEGIIVNTCCFIGDAKEESINTILEMAGYKETGKCQVRPRPPQRHRGLDVRPAAPGGGDCLLPSG